ncbi:MAG: hypothetical protein OEV44_00005 [Spirochaetota bacterium]|nr:hypothetical protein [Spirochaetota bacterium]
MNINSKNPRRVNLAKSWTNSTIYPYESFISNGVNISVSINTISLASAYTNSIDIIAGEKYLVKFYMQLNSVKAPDYTFYLNGNGISGQATTARYTAVQGHNYRIITIDTSYNNAEFVFRTDATSDLLDFSIINFKMIKII